jgi:hypothetical protein
MRSNDMGGKAPGEFGIAVERMVDLHHDVV